MATDRASAGGGKALAINPSSYTPSVSYGTGEGSSWFGPGKPLKDQVPVEVKGRAFDFPMAANLLTDTRPQEPVGYATLRAFADSYDILRLVIETRKDQMERLRWVIQPRDNKEKMTPQRRNKIKALSKFFLKPDGEHSWNDWLRMILEDLFVVDAVTLHRRRTRGGQLVALDQIDGATMRRVLDDWGRTPEDPNDTAYQQILHGMRLNYRRDEVYFRPRNLRVHKIYGFSPVQQIMMTINIALRRQVFQLNFFTEGNMPPALIGVPETWTPDQIRIFQEWFDNIMTGNLAERRRARFVPNAVGKTYIPTQETELFGMAEEWLARVVCFTFSLSPLPFIKMTSRQGADAGQRESEATGLAPVKSWVKYLIDDVLSEDFGEADLEFVWKNDDELDAKKRQEITSGNLRDGLITVNEGRVDQGREPYDDPIYDKPMFITSNGLAPLVMTSDAQGASPKVDEQGNPINGGVEGNGVPGVQKLASLEELVALGDPDLLADFLRKMENENGG